MANIDHIKQQRVIELQADRFIATSNPYDRLQPLFTLSDGSVHNPLSNPG